MPDSIESRMARLEQRVSDFETQLTRLLPVAEAQARNQVQLEHIEDLAQRTNKDLHTFQEKIDTRDEQRDEAVSAERRATRNALYALAGTLGAALIGALAIIVVALLGGQGP
jgi:CHASE3 domain sensor protein